MPNTPVPAAATGLPSMPRRAFIGGLATVPLAAAASLVGCQPVPAIAAFLPEDARATDLGRPPEPQWPVARGFDMEAECANVRAASERCNKACNECDRYRALVDAIPTDDEAAWEIEYDRLTTAWGLADKELMAASRHYSEVRDGFTYRLLYAHGIADVFNF